MGAAKGSSEYRNVGKPGCHLKGAIWPFLYITYVTDIMDQQVKWREGLSHLTSIMNEGRERQRERRKIAYSY